MKFWISYFEIYIEAPVLVKFGTKVGQWLFDEGNFAAIPLLKSPSWLDVVTVVTSTVMLASHER